MNQYIASIIPDEYCKSIIMIVCDNAKRNRCSFYSCSTLTLSPEDEKVDIIQLPALRLIRKLPIVKTNSRRSNCKQKAIKEKNHKKNNVSRMLMLSPSSFLNKSFSKRRIIHAADEAMLLVTNDKNEFTAPESKQYHKQNRKIYKNLACHGTMHMDTSSTDRESTSNQSVLLLSSTTLSPSSTPRVLVSYAKHIMDKDHTKNRSVVPPQMPRRQKSLMQLLKSSSLRRMNDSHHQHINGTPMADQKVGIMA